MKDLMPGINEADPGDDELFARWQMKYASALKATAAAAEHPGALIEAAAQHPLRDGRYPNPEFAARLDAAYALSREFLAQGVYPVKIYVPGSIHMTGGVSDKVSLSDAECIYLAERGVHVDDLLGDDENRRYKGDSGIYNSSDECYVASRIFKDYGFGQIHCVCSPAQLLRKALSYIQFGLVPYMHSVPVNDMFHSYVDEAFLYIPRLLADGNGLQGNSAEARRLRVLRKPKG